MAIYGQRRVGKTYLVREHFKKELCFELTGLQSGKLKDQLAYFHEELERRTKKSGLDLPQSWQEAFKQLRYYLEKLRGDKKRVIFLDEIPWLDSHKSGFKKALDYFWNTYLSRHPRFILIITGSAASWIVKNVINDKGGLHNRITAPPLCLEPFKLGEIEAYLKSNRVSLTRYDIITLAMVMGGIPMYLKDVEPGQSAAQAIQNTVAGCIDLTKLFQRVHKLIYFWTVRTDLSTSSKSSFQKALSPSIRHTPRSYVAKYKFLKMLQGRRRMSFLPF